MEPTSYQKKFRVGIVGAGYVSPYHVRALRTLDSVDITGVADPDEERRDKLASTFKIPVKCNTLEELLQTRPDVIHILTPPHLHADLAIEAMRGGCHVFVEKPLAESVEDCDRMIAVSKETGRQLAVNHSARMDPVVLRALDMVKAGACGDILSVTFLRNSDYPPYAGGPIPAPYRRAGYPFEDIGIHGLYLLETFLGPIKDVDIRYRSSGRNPYLFFDEWHTLAECEKGVGHMYLSWNVQPMQNELIIHGTGGIIRIDCYLQTMTVEKTLPAPKPLQRMLGTTLSALSLAWRVPINAFKFITGRLQPNPGILGSIVRFYDALACGTPMPAPAEEGRRMVAFVTRPAQKAEASRAQAFVTRPVIVKPKVLVTGATGFLGGALLRRLKAEGKPVRILARRPLRQSEWDPNVEVVYGDLGNPVAVEQAIEGIETVYHVGATMAGGKADHERGSIVGTKNVVDSCLRHGVQRLVYVSSIIHLHYSGHQSGKTVDESYPLEPHADKRGFYTQAKLQAEQIVKDAIRDHQLPAIILRPGQIFGRGAERSSPTGAIGLGGRWVVIGSGKLPLPLVYVEDVVDALLLAAKKEGIFGSIFHIVDPTVVTQNEYVTYCRRFFGNELKVVYAPKPIMFLAALAADMVSKLTRVALPLSVYRLESSRPIHPFDVSVAQRRLGWTPRIGSMQGLEATFGRERTNATSETAVAVAGS